MSSRRFLRTMMPAMLGWPGKVGDDIRVARRAIDCTRVRNRFRHIGYSTDPIKIGEPSDDECPLYRPTDQVGRDATCPSVGHLRGCLSGRRDPVFGRRVTTE